LPCISEVPPTGFGYPLDGVSLNALESLFQLPTLMGLTPQGVFPSPGRTNCFQLAFRPCAFLPNIMPNSDAPTAFAPGLIGTSCSSSAFRVEVGPMPSRASTPLGLPRGGYEKVYLWPSCPSCPSCRYLRKNIDPGLQGIPPTELASSLFQRTPTRLAFSAN
jgi:hypothetical protein